MLTRIKQNYKIKDMKRMFTLFEFAIDSEGIGITLLAIKSFTLFAFIASKDAFGFMLFNVPIGIKWRNS